MSCYYPNGNPSSGDIPCHSGGGASPCCPNGWNCESNGLCSLAAQGFYGRYTCTDKTWQSESCPQFCTQSNKAPGDEAVLQCSSGSYCCDANRPDDPDQDPPKPGCCDTTTSRFSLAALPIIAGSSNGGSSNGGSSNGGSSNGGSSNAASSSSTSTSSSSASPSTSTSSSTTSSSTSTSSSPPPSIPTQRSITLTPSVATSSTTSSSETFTTTSSTSSASSQAASSTTSSTTSSTSSQASQSSTSSSPSFSVVTSVITSNGGQSTLITSTSTSATAAPASATLTPHSKPLGPIIGPAVAVPVAVLAIAALMLFFFLRSRRSRREHPSPSTAGPPESPKPMYGEPKPPHPAEPELNGSPVTAAFNKDTALYHDPTSPAQSPTTAPPSYRGSMGANGAQNTNRDSRGTDPTIAGSPTSPELHGNAVVGEVGEGARPPSELVGNIYRPYRPFAGGV